MSPSRNAIKLQIAKAYREIARSLQTFPYHRCVKNFCEYAYVWPRSLKRKFYCFFKQRLRLLIVTVQSLRAI